MTEAGQTGVWEIIFIAVAIVWLLNALRRRSILKKMEQEVDYARQNRRSSNTVDQSQRSEKKRETHISEDAEYVDYEIIE